MLWSSGEPDTSRDVRPVREGVQPKPPTKVGMARLRLPYHLIVYSTDINKGYLTNQGIGKLRSTYANYIFKDELQHLYDEQNDVRNALRNNAKDIAAQLIEQIETGDCTNPRLELLIVKLHEQLEAATGKKVYGYLPKAVKATVDDIVKVLAADERIKQLYEKWQELEKDKLKNYTDQPSSPVSLEQQKEFRSIKNAIIQASLNLNQPLSELEFEKADSYSSILDSEPDEVEDQSFSTHAGFPECKFEKDFLFGINELQDVEKGVELLKQSSALGFSTAEYLLGNTYLQGDLVEQDISEAIQWLTHAAEKGNAYASFKLGKLYISAEYKTPDCHLAEKWLQVAAQQDSHNAQYALGKLYLEEKLYDPQKAIYRLTQSAMHENSYAQLKLARLYLDGNLVPKDAKLALELFERSGIQNNSYSQYALGKLYFYGTEIPRNSEKALYWLQRSAANENPFAKQLLTRIENSPSPSALGTAMGLLQHLARMMRSHMDLTHHKPQNMRTESKLLAEIAEKKASLGIKDGRQQRV